MEIFSQIIGWMGTLLIVLAYFLVSNNKISAYSKSYQLFNLFGAIGVGFNVFYQHAWPAVVLQIVWIVIAIFSLMKIKNNLNFSYFSRYFYNKKFCEARFTPLQSFLVIRYLT